YQFRSSLYLTNGYGEPIALPPDLRIYLLSAFQHGGNNPAEFPGPRGNCQNLTNPNYHGPTLRALLIALDRWADRGVSPPDSAVPSVRHRSEEHTSELQSLTNLVCRLLLEKKNTRTSPSSLSP